MVQTTYTQGTTAIDKTREADNKYQLNSIDGNTGWTLVSEMGRQVLVKDEFDGVWGDINTRLPAPINVISGTEWIKKSYFTTSIQIPFNGSGTGVGAKHVSGNAIYTLDLLTDGLLKLFLL